jgi:hypothetical protein
MASPFVLIRDAVGRLTTQENEIIRVIGSPTRDAGLLIEVTMETAPLRSAMIDYGIRILLLSAVISIFTAILLFAAVRVFLVRPIKGVVDYMQRYAAAPEDARGIITPSAGVIELREAEDACVLQQFRLQLGRQHVIRQKRKRRDLSPLQTIEQIVFAETRDGRDENKDFGQHHEDRGQNQESA